MIAPAGPAAPGVLDQVPGLIERLGFRPKVFPGCWGPSKLPHLAATDDQRLADLHAALSDPDVRAILCLRGGYGCLRLVDRIDTQLVRQAAKPLIGYSDITTLHGLWLNAGVPAWHAPMPASDWLQDGAWPDAEALANTLLSGLRANDALEAQSPKHALDQGAAVEGRLIGGNLSVLASCLGTRAEPDWRGAILFLEDVAEDPYRVDRYLAQLRLAGALQAVNGFLLGRFSNAEPADAVLADYLGPLGKPVLANWPAGHEVPNRVLRLGVRVRMDPTARRLAYI